jgi:hypothetical protein
MDADPTQDRPNPINPQKLLGVFEQLQQQQQGLQQALQAALEQQTAQVAFVGELVSELQQLAAVPEPTRVEPASQGTAPPEVDTVLAAEPAVAEVKAPSVPTDRNEGGYTLAQDLPDASLDLMSDRELSLGSRWLGRIGTVLLLIGIALALTYTYQHMNALGKLFLGLLAGCCFVGVGLWVRQSVVRVGNLLAGVGMACGYMSVFGAFFIPSIQLVSAPLAGFLVLTVYSLGMLGLSNRLGSETMAVISLGFAYLTVHYSNQPEAALIMALLLSVVTLANLAKHPLWDKLLPVMLLGTVSTAQYATTVTATPFVEVFYHGISFCLLGFTALKYGAPRAGLGVLAVMGWISYWGLGHLAEGHPLWGHGGLAVLIYMGYAIFYGLQCVAGPIFQSEPRVWVASEETGRLEVDLSRYPVQVRDTLWIQMILFIAVAGLQYFDSEQQPMAWSVLALGAAWLSAKGVHAALNKAVSTLALVASGGMAVWADLGYGQYLWQGAIILVCQQLRYRASATATTFLMMLTFTVLLVGLNKGVDPTWLTLHSVLIGAVLMAWGIWRNQKSYRWFALSWWLLVSGVGIVRDVFVLPIPYRIASFIALGVVMLVGSYAYSRLEQRLSPPKP